MPTQDQERPQDAVPGRAAARLMEVSQRVRAARGASEDDPLEEARRLASIERDLLVVSGDLVRSDPNLADDRGHPVLAEVARWRSRLPGRELVRRPVGAGPLLVDLVEDEATALARDAPRRRSPGHVPGRASTCSPRPRHSTRRRCAVGARRRHAAAARPTARRSARPCRTPVARIRRAEAVRDRWVTDLLDRADVVLTASTSWTRSGVRRNSRCARDDLAWHLDHVERENGKPRRRDCGASYAACGPSSRSGDLQARLEAHLRRALRRAVRAARRSVLIFLVLGLLAVEVTSSTSRRRRRQLVRRSSTRGVPGLPLGLLLPPVPGQGEVAVVSPPRARRPHPLPARRAAVAHHAGPDPHPRRTRRPVPARRPAWPGRAACSCPSSALVRALGFLTRGIDRVVRRYGHLLNRDVILYPTREEKARARAAKEETSGRASGAWKPRSRISGTISSSPPRTRPSGRPSRNRRIDGLADARRTVSPGTATRRRAHAAPARGRCRRDACVRRLESRDRGGHRGEVGADFVARAARAVRVFGRPPLRWIPVLARATRPASAST